MAEQQKKEFTTALSQWSNEVTGLVRRDYESVGVTFDEYSRTCAMNAMTSIFHLVQQTDKASLNQMDTSNLREVVAQAASLKLNANAMPRECYFQLRNKKIGDKYVKVVEMGVEGNGNDAMLRNFGVGVKTVYPCWLVKEGDEFTYPKRKGMRMEPPEWEEKGLSNKVVRVVYPILLNDGTEQYLIAERDGVKTNLFAHIKNNLLNETFGIAESSYKATPKQKEQIKAKKEEIFAELRKCETVDEMLACEVARPYMSPAWLDTPESMIIRKMRNNAIKNFPKDMNSIANRSMLELDDTYKASREEVESEANSVDFEEGEVVEVEAETVDTETDVVES
jgi:hypothetical protein